MSLASTAPGLLSETKGFLRAAACFDEAGTVDAYLLFEAALAEVQGALGVIPAEAAPVITNACCREALDMELLRQRAATIGYPIVPLADMVAECAGEQGRWVHYGTTTQDVMDTAQVLQLRAALAPALEELQAIENLLVALTVRYRRTPMAGRSKLQHGVPIPFGYKTAVWLDQIYRCRLGLQRALLEASVLQFGGAVGTLAALGDRGIEVRAALARRLKLAEPDISWHVSRDRMVSLASGVAVTMAAIARMAGDVTLLMSTEVAELREPAAAGRGSSSTMPQKRNPVISEAIIEASRESNHTVGELLGTMQQEHERGIGHGYRERAAMAKQVTRFCGVVSLAQELLTGLEVDAGRMARNLGLTGEQIQSEAIMIELARKIGRIEAHHLLHKLSHGVTDLRSHLRDKFGLAIPCDEELTAKQLESAQGMIDCVLATVG